MLNNKQKERLIDTLKQMDVQGGNILIFRNNKTSLGNVRDNQKMTAMIMAYDDNNFCLYDFDTENSMEIPFDRIEKLYIDIEDMFIDEGREISMNFKVDKTEYCIYCNG